MGMDGCLTMIYCMESIALLWGWWIGCVGYMGFIDGSLYVVL